MGIRHTDEIDQLFAALAEAQGEIDNAKKDEQNPHFKSSYADLASVRSAIRAPFAAHGLSVLQFPSTEIRPLDNGGVWMGLRLITRLCHASGQWIEDELLVPVARQDAQSIGSAITYARRYSLMAITGVAPDDDDDGNAAAGNRQPQGGGLPYPHNGQSRPHQQQGGQQQQGGGQPAANDAANALAHYKARIRQATSLASLKAFYSSSLKDLQARGASQDQLADFAQAKDDMKAQLDPPAADQESTHTNEPAQAGVEDHAPAQG